MSKYKIDDTENIQPGQLIRRESPYEMFIRDIKSQGDYYTYPEVCKMLAVSQPTLRKAVRGTKIPSKYVQWGKRHVWLFTKDDVEDASDILDVKVKWA